MPKARIVFFCTSCGNEAPRWQGQCSACGEWNTIAEQPAGSRQQSAGQSSAGFVSAEPVALADVDGSDLARVPAGIQDLDFVLGGGVVPGSLILVGGDPGIGKSTLLLQMAGRLEVAGVKTLYVSGEESPAQVRLRAERLGPHAVQVMFLGASSLESILEHAERMSPSVLVLDSIQTTYAADAEGAPGGMVQLRECALRLQRYAKSSGVAVFLVGHVTKGGEVAGPRTLEHIVDTVLYFESLGDSSQRVLRATKNRFGSVDEIAIFDMTAAGLEPVDNPSELFLGGRKAGPGGGAVVPVLEGSRPLLVEVQVLCAAASYGAPQRVATGFDRQRLAVLLAVLESHGGVNRLGQLDVFLKVVGGARLVEPAADLAVAAALAGAARGTPVPTDAVFLGEVGLAGELRAAGQVDRRLAEAARMGFRRVFLPRCAASQRLPDALEVIPLDRLGDMMERLHS